MGERVKPKLVMAGTVVDSLDTLYIMGLEEEYEEARQFVATDFNPDRAVS